MRAPHTLIGVDAFLDPHPAWIAIGGIDHVLYVLGLLGVGAALVGCRDLVRRHARTVRRVVLAVLVVQQLTLYGFYALTGGDLADALPLHISRVSALLAVAYLATGSRRVMDVLFYFGLWAWASFAYPQNVQPASTLLGWSFWVNHVVTLLMPFFAVITSTWRPTVPALLRASGWFLLYVVVAVVANHLTGGNYFYQREQPLLPGLPQPWYLLASVAATFALFWLGYGVSRMLLRRLHSRP